MTLLASIALVFASCAPLTPATPESQGVDSAAILRWLDACEQTYDGSPRMGALHGFVILRHGRLIAEGSWRPFETLTRPHMLYSHSKSFTSSAVGLLVDDGVLDLDERVVEIFPESVPSVVSPHLAQLRVRDLLTMNAGKRDHLLADGGDWVKEFLAQDFMTAPGCGFRYDSDATYLLAAIVERRSGRKMMDLLKERLFDPIGITSARTTYSPQGIPCGGWGMDMTTRDLARFGQLYLQQGEWNGQTVLSADWVTLATTRQTWSSAIKIGRATIGSGSDWEQGYGFQFWRCHHGAYRADGAYGQYTIVIPRLDAVISINAGINNMQKALDLIWETLLPGFSDAPLTESAAAETLASRLQNLARKPVESRAVPSVAATGVTFSLQQPARGFTTLRVDPTDSGWLCRLGTPAGEQAFPIGRGCWAEGSMRIDTETYQNLGGYIDTFRTMASGGLDEQGRLQIVIYLADTTARFNITLDAQGVNGLFWGMRAETKLTATR